LGEVLPHAELSVLRGIEGARAKASYRHIAEQFGVEWKGRRFDRENPDQDDAINQAINHAATAVQAAAMVAVSVTGALPSLGFIHEDSGISFVLDIADLYRDSITLPLAFGAVRELGKNPDASLERLVRRLCGRVFREKQIVSAMIDRIKELLGVE
jgi:CRISPR-associated protein Cas1